MPKRRSAEGPHGLRPEDESLIEAAYRTVAEVLHRNKLGIGGLGRSQIRVDDLTYAFSVRAYPMPGTPLHAQARREYEEFTERFIAGLE